MSEVQQCREIGRHTYPARPKRGTSHTCERCGTVRTVGSDGQVSYVFPDLEPEPGFIEAPPAEKDWTVGLSLTIRAVSEDEAASAAEDMLSSLRLDHPELLGWEPGTLAAWAPAAVAEGES
jgi:hypothetical protein